MTTEPNQPPFSKSGRMDPAKVDVATKPKRRRRARNRPEPPDALRNWEKAAEARALARPYPPNVILEPAGANKEQWTPPHSDVELWTLQLGDAFGTRSFAVIDTFMAQLEALCTQSHYDREAKQWRLDEHEFSAALAIVNSVKPRNELEAALAAQMVAVHLMTMQIAARAIKDLYDTRTAAVAAKLARTFTIQMEALRATRSKSRTARQSIKVRKDLHQHVHYHDHRGGSESESQPHGPGAQAADQCAALPSPQPGGKVVPLSSRKRKARV
jgi:hypothetical protein